MSIEEFDAWSNAQKTFNETAAVDESGRSRFARTRAR